MPASPRRAEQISATPAPPAVVEIKTKSRSLYHVGWLAYLLEELGCLQNSTEFEAAIEEDGSAVPGQLLDALKALGAVLVAMTQEEVAELLAGDDDDDDIGEVIEMSATGAKRAMLSAIVKLDRGAVAALTAAAQSHLRGEKVTFTSGGRPVAQLARAGRVLSAENERCLREAHDHISKAADIVRGVVDLNDDNANPEVDDPDANEDNVDDDESRALRMRKANAKKRKLIAATAT